MTDDLTELRQRVASLEAALSRLAGGVRRLEDPHASVFLAQRNGTNGAFFEVVPNLLNSALAASDDGRVVEEGDTDQRLIPLLQASPILAVNNGEVTAYVDLTPPMLIVELRTDGGADGSLSGAPTYSYTANYVEGGDEIATGLLPIAGRPFGKASAAEYGIGYFKFGGFVLVHAFEIPSTGGCS